MAAAPRTRPWPVLLLATLVASPALAAAAPMLGSASASPAAGAGTGVPEPPLLGFVTPRGGVAWLGEPVASAAAPVPKVVDGAIADWVGHGSLLGGTTVLDRGELVYQDFLFDDHGADDGKDAERRALLRGSEAAVPTTKRLEALSQAAGAQFDLGPADPTGGMLVAKERFGDAALPADLQGRAEGHADLLEVRVAADAEDVFLLARMVTMHDAALPALLLLADTDAAGSALAAHRPVPFGSGLATHDAELALLITQAGVHVAAVDGEGSREPALLEAADVVVEPAGYTNAIEARLPRSLLAPDGVLRIAFAAGLADPSGDARLAPVATGDGRAQLVNVAFRSEQRVAVWFDHDQALALRRGDIDPFFTDVPLAALEQGLSQPWQATPGYHERVFVSSEAISEEHGREGIHQPYGLYLPDGWFPGRDAPWPLTFWLPWRGARAHSHAAWAPRLLDQLGDGPDALVVAPRGRGPTSWYVGTGHQDFLEVWDDVHRSFAIDPYRVGVTGISMGGYGSYLLGLLYPDRFAAAWPIAGPVTQGAWLGVDEATGSDVVETNDGDAAAQLVYRIAENALHVPFLVFHNSADQAVPATGIARMALRFEELGYRHRLVVFPGYEHHTTAVMDEWRLGAAWFDDHPRTAPPGRVVYKVSPALERAVETLHAGNATLDFTFDGAHWLRGLAVRDANPDDLAGFGMADVRSLALPEAHQAVPDVGAGAVTDGHVVPHAWKGTAWLTRPTPAADNGFEATFTNIAEARLDLTGMGLDAARTIEATVVTDGPLRLRLTSGAGSGAEEVLVLDAGTHRLPLDLPSLAAVEGGDLAATGDRDAPGPGILAGLLAGALAALLLAGMGAQRGATGRGPGRRR